MQKTAIQKLIDDMAEYISDPAVDKAQLAHMFRVMADWRQIDERADIRRAHMDGSTRPSKSSSDYFNETFGE